MSQKKITREIKKNSKQKDNENTTYKLHKMHLVQGLEVNL